MITLAFTDFFGKRQSEKRLTSIIRKHEKILPWWVNRLQVSLDESGDYLSTNFDPKYRVGRLFVSPKFLSFDQEHQETTIVHEFIHGIIWPYSGYVQSALIEPIKEKNPELYAFLVEEHSKLLESLTEDLAILLCPYNEITGE